MINYRPWGQLKWLLDKIDIPAWDILSCVASELRCTSVIKTVTTANQIRSAHFLNIEDPPSRFTPAVNGLIEKNWHLIRDIHNDSTQEKRQLLDAHHHIITIANNLIAASQGNIILDISCLPKRYFFPILKIMNNNGKVKNLIVTNSIPFRYTDSQLAEDYQEIKALPLFKEEPFSNHNIVILSVGHISMGLPETIVSQVGDKSIDLYIPFPGSQQSDKPTWQFVHRIYNEIDSNQVNIRRTSAKDVSSAYDNIFRSTSNNKKTPLLLPFGPKPIALAMCLYAIKTKVPVCYTQPLHYHPEYSIGVRMEGEHPCVLGYPIILNGRKLYQ